MSDQPTDIIRASDWVTVSDTARRAGVSRQAIHKAIRSGRLRAVHFGPRAVFINKRDANRYIESREEKAS